jgi:nickel/cobalt transporter (NicO) family protein
MGPESVNRYARIEPAARGAHIRYVLDFGESAAAQLAQPWNDSLARAWVKNLGIAIGGRSVSPLVASIQAGPGAGEGGRPTLRAVMDLELAAAPGRLTYEDRNFPGSAGWQEIVVGSGPDRSGELTRYEPGVAPRDLKVEVEWTGSGMAMTKPAEPPAPGGRNDYLAELLHRGELGPGLILMGMAVAFGLGAVHALSPGHGKTIVAAYLVGARGTAKHAVFLGGMVTLTHTVSVFLLGFVTLFLSRYVLPSTLFPVLGAISGISIVWIGATLLVKRARALRGGHSHGHHRHPEHDHPHDHAGLAHDHGDGHVHSHVPEGEVTMGSLVALGASGGLVPCPSALVLLLSSIALGRVALGLTLLVAFSAGLAMVLTAIGLAVVYASHLLPDREKAARSPLLRLVPVLSAGVIVCVGLVMTAMSLGWFGRA